MILLSEKYWEFNETVDRGKGIFAKKDINPGIVLGDYLGTVLRTRDVDIKDDEKNLYLVYYHDDAAIYPNLKKPGIHLLNHSCTPNASMYTYFGHVLFFVLRHIFAGEEITVSYMLSPLDEFCKPCTHICVCKSSFCNQTMHLSTARYKKWREHEEINAKKTKRKRISYNRELPKLSLYPKNIPDHKIYSLFGNDKKPPIESSYKVLPTIRALRGLIRSTGRTIALPKLNTKILGIEENIIISEALTQKKNQSQYHHSKIFN